MPKSGLVALIGRPNVGKSTLLNQLVGQKVAIVSNKPQTTRNRILGVQTTEECQMIFLDTPGIHRPGHLLNKRMMEEVYDSLRGVDLLVHIVDVSERYGRGEKFVLNLVQKTQKPTILALNKVDLISKGKILPVLEFYNQPFSVISIHLKVNVFKIPLVPAETADIWLFSLQGNNPVTHLRIVELGHITRGRKAPGGGMRMVNP